MTCHDCQDLISFFLDHELGSEMSAELTAHLAVCDECSLLLGDLSAIAESCRDFSSEAEPPNPNALWCRINNVIESEVRKDVPVRETPRPRGFLKRVFSLSQVAAAVLGIGLISSLLTIVFLKNYFEPTSVDNISRSSATQTTFEKLMGRVGLIETPEEARVKRVREQEAAIIYWNERVQSRRSQWDAHLRAAFDRNLSEIDQAVNEYTLILQKDPQDELSGEMLDSALNEKMNLLRAFSEL